MAGHLTRTIKVQRFCNNYDAVWVVGFALPALAPKGLFYKKQVVVYIEMARYVWKNTYFAGKVVFAGDLNIAWTPQMLLDGTTYPDLTIREVQAGMLILDWPSNGGIWEVEG